MISDHASNNNAYSDNNHEACVKDFHLIFKYYFENQIIRNVIIVLFYTMCLNKRIEKINVFLNN